VSASDPLLDREAIEQAFRRLGGRLARRGLVADVYVFDGAAMALAHDARRATRDIDAVFEPHDAGAMRSSRKFRPSRKIRYPIAAHYFHLGSIFRDLQAAESHT